MRQKLLTNIFFTFIATLLIVYFFPRMEVNHYKFEEGRPWNYAKLIAPFDIPILPDSATILYVRDSLSRTFIPVFERDPEAVNTVITNLMAGWSHADNERPATDQEAAMRRKAVAYIRSAYSNDVIDDEFGQRIDDGLLPTIRITQANTVRSSNTKGITHPSRIIAGMSRALGVDTLMAISWIQQNNLANALIPNLPFSQETSARLYQSDLDRYTAIKGVIQQGQTVIDKGAIITPQDYTNLLTYERMVEEEMSSGDNNQWLMLLGQFLFVGALLTSLLIFLHFTSPDVWRNRSAMLFIMLSITLFFFIAVALDDSLGMSIYLMPFAIVPVLMIVFFDAPTALFVSFVLALLCGGTVAFPLEFIILQMMASVAAVYTLKDLTQRSQLLQMSLMVMIAYVIGYASIELMFNDSFDGWQWRMVVYLIVSGALSSIAYILMVAVERIFGFVSMVTLIELADANNPILRELSQECPGTFQHSMAVSNLATDAAIKIHANEQLVRAGAMYHDIGKMSNPNFYTENQRGVNPHDALPIERSAQIIIGHVAEGLARADKAGLPMVIKDFIAQHHGHGKAKYFYFNYCKQHPGETVDPEPFTYPGPNPQSRETSLLMMADAVEAASRSLDVHTPQAITDLVNKIIDGQIADGLHSEAPLTFRDIGIIKETFVRRLLTMHHSRIVYPDDPNKKEQETPQAPPKLAD